MHSVTGSGEGWISGCLLKSFSLTTAVRARVISTWSYMNCSSKVFATDKGTVSR